MIADDCRLDFGLNRSGLPERTVLVVDRDPAPTHAVGLVLAARGMKVLTARAAASGLRLVAAEQPDVVILGLGLPDLDGLTVLRMIRSVSDCLVVIVSPPGKEETVVEAFDTGADDYIVTPLSVTQTVARVEAMLRRLEAQPVVKDVIVVGGLRVDIANRTALLEEGRVVLTRKEFDLLALLASRAGQVVDRPTIFRTIWGVASRVGQTVDVHVSGLRRKLGETAAQPRYLHTVRGVGFRLGLNQAE